MPIQAPQWTEYLSCTVCCKEFHWKSRRPISLACGHTMCKACLHGLSSRQCPFDQSAISSEVNYLPDNFAIISLTPHYNADLKINKRNISYSVLKIPEEDICCYENSVKCIEELAPLLKISLSDNRDIASPILSRPMQRKLVALINCQLVEDEGRCRALRAARSLGERVVTELILQHQNSQQLCINLWAAVRARGCQFLGPAMQEEVLKLILLALEEGCALSRKVLVMFVVQRLEPHFPQASKTSIGHVVQLLYRASCFKVFKREKDSSLMKLKDEFRTYEALRREHDAQIVQIAMESGLRIAPDQWSSLLYADTAHKSHMQSIMDKLQTPQSFSQSVQELIITLQRTGDSGNLASLQPQLELLSCIDVAAEENIPTWKNTETVMSAIRSVVISMVAFIKSRGSRKAHDHSQTAYNKFKTSMCRNFSQRKACPTGANCNFAHSQEELEKYRAKSKRGPLNRQPLQNNLAANRENLSDKDFLENLNSFNNFETEEVSKQFANLQVHKNPFRQEENIYRKTLSATQPEYFNLADSNWNNVSNTTLSWTTTNGQLLSSGLSASKPHTINSHPGNNLILQSFHATNGQPQPTLIALPPQASPGPSPVQAIPVSIFPPTISPNGYHPNIQPAHILAGQAVAIGPATGVTGEDAISLLSPTCFDPTTGYQISQGDGYRGSFYHVMNVEGMQPDMVLNSVDKLAYLEERKHNILAHLGKVHDYSTSQKPKNQEISHKTRTETALKRNNQALNEGVFSPWPSSNKMDQMNPIQYAVVSVSNENVKTNNHQMKSEEFSASDDDQFIPFDPPLASRFGPISRFPRSILRTAAPIQVSATIDSGMVAITPVVQQPVPAPSPAPSIYLQPSSGHPAHVHQFSQFDHLYQLQKHKPVSVFFNDSIPSMVSRNDLKMELMHLEKEINNIKSSNQNTFSECNLNEPVSSDNFEDSSNNSNNSNTQDMEPELNYVVHTSICSWDQEMLQADKSNEEQ